MKFLLALALLSFTLAQSDLKYVNDPEALCLDGSRASFYVQYGFGSGARKYLFYFQGGAWIEGLTEQQLLNSAYQRSSTELGSSKSLPKIRKFDGIFNRQEDQNPEFYNWNTIHVNYCDGSGHQGYKKEPVQVLEKLLYFRGELIFKSIFQEYKEAFNNADTVIVSGCSAGALSAFQYVDYFRDELPQGVKVLGVPDSGIFQDLPAIDGTRDSRISLGLLQNLVNVETASPNKRCNQFEEEKWKCFYAQYLMRYIETPIFMVQSLYDHACIQGLLKIQCAANYTLSRCTAKERTVIEDHHQDTLMIIKGRIEYDQQSGAFAPSCIEHCFLQYSRYNQRAWSVNSLTISEALVKWLRTYQSGNNRYLDVIDWPYNSGCSNVNR